MKNDLLYFIDSLSYSIKTKSATLYLLLLSSEQGMELHQRAQEVFKIYKTKNKIKEKLSIPALSIWTRLGYLWKDKVNENQKKSLSDSDISKLDRLSDIQKTMNEYHRFKRSIDVLNEMSVYVKMKSIDQYKEGDLVNFEDLDIIGE